MIICIVENSIKWDDFGLPYLVDTSKLNSYLKSDFESLNSSELVYSKKVNSLKTSDYLYSYHDWWSDTVFEDLQQAIVQPPQLVDKLVSIIFE